MHVHVHARHTHTHTPRQETCHPYWPSSIDSTAQYGKLLVTLKSENLKEDRDREFIIRKFEITEGKVRTLLQ